MERGEINGYLIQMQNSNELHSVDSLGRIWLKEEKQCLRTSGAADAIPQDRLYENATIDCIDENRVRENSYQMSLDLYH